MVCIDVQQKRVNNDNNNSSSSSSSGSNTKNKISGLMILFIVCVGIIIIIIIAIFVVVLFYKKVTFIPEIAYSFDDPLIDNRTSEDLIKMYKFLKDRSFYYTGSVDPRSEDIKNLVNKFRRKDFEDYNSSPKKFEKISQLIIEIRDLSKSSKSNVYENNVDLNTIVELAETFALKTEKLFNLLNSVASVSFEGVDVFRCTLCNKLFETEENIRTHHRLKHLDSLDHYIALSLV